MNPAPTAKYSLHWANSVVSDLWRKHPRVHEVFGTVLGISDRMLAKLLADGRPEYAKLRELIKILDSWEQRTPGVLNTRLHRDAFIKMYAGKVPEKLAWYLTDQLKQPTLEEQGSRGGG